MGIIQLEILFAHLPCGSLWFCHGCVNGRFGWPIFALYLHNKRTGVCVDRSLMNNYIKSRQ